MEEQPKQKAADEKFIQDFEEWAKQFPNPEEELFCYDNECYSIRQILNALNSKTKLGKDFLETYRSLSEKLGINPMILIQAQNSTN